MATFASPPQELLEDMNLSGEERAETLMALLRDERNAMRIIVGAARKLKQEKEDLAAERDASLAAAAAGREALARAQGAEQRIRMLEALLEEERNSALPDAKERISALELLLRDEREAMVILVQASDNLRVAKDSLTEENEALRKELAALKLMGAKTSTDNMWRISTGPNSAGVAYRNAPDFSDKAKDGENDVGMQDGELVYALGVERGSDGIKYVRCSNEYYMPITSPDGSVLLSNGASVMDLMNLVKQRNGLEVRVRGMANMQGQHEAEVEALKEELAMANAGPSKSCMATTSVTWTSPTG